MSLTVIIHIPAAASGSPAAADGLQQALDTLIAGARGEAAESGFQPEILLVGSTETLHENAAMAGARIIKTPPRSGPGHQRAADFIAGAREAKGDWLLFLHGGIVPERGWAASVMVFANSARSREHAGVFSFAIASGEAAGHGRAIWPERIMRWRNRWLGLPCGEQGLLIHRHFYHRLGGHADIPSMEDVDILRRIGMHRLVLLDIRALAMAENCRRNALAGLLCLILFFLRVPPGLLARFCP